MKIMPSFLICIAHNRKVGFADSIFSGRLSYYSGNIASDISYIIK